MMIGIYEVLFYIYIFFLLANMISVLSHLDELIIEMAAAIDIHMPEIAKIKSFYIYSLLLLVVASGPIGTYLLNYPEDNGKN
jgi:hypothetical protein